jgi:hypothetical protein
VKRWTLKAWLQKADECTRDLRRSTANLRFNADKKFEDEKIEDDIEENAEVPEWEEKE